jgi:hypothetical protein
MVCGVRAKLSPLMKPSSDQPQAITCEAAAAVFVARESAEVALQTLRALVAAMPLSCCVDLLVNGNPAVAAELAQRLPSSDFSREGLQLRVWSIALADKSNAWNEYVHRIWPGAERTFFVDGYAQVLPGALQALRQTLQDQPEALAVTGVPSEGPSASVIARNLIEGRGLHGNLFALRASAVDRIRKQGLRLPVGLYRSDSTIAAAIAFGLDPAQHTWSASRFVAVCTQASWHVQASPWFSWGQIQLRWRRRMRQAQGDLENWAVRYHWQIERRGIASLEGTVEALVSNWARDDPVGFRQRLSRHPLRRLAWKRLLAALPEAGASGTAELRAVC